MNKPAAKEPSMDEILSSIRQIIADDDAAAVPPVRPAPRDMAAPPAAPVVAPRASAASGPLALTASQMVPDAEPGQAAMPGPAPSLVSAFADATDAPMDGAFDMPAGEPELIDPEDIAFETDDEPEPPPPPPVVAAPVIRAPAPPPRAPEPPPAPRPAASVAQAAPMPDPQLSSDMADELLAPATNAAVQGTMAKLGALAAVETGGQTIEGIMRELLRPMLKDWLDENLPSVVERMVEREIARVSRGVK